MVLRVRLGVMRDVDRHADHEPGQASGVEARARAGVYMCACMGVYVWEEAEAEAEEGVGLWVAQRMAARNDGCRSERKTGRQAGRQADRQTDRQGGRSAGRQAGGRAGSANAQCTMQQRGWPRRAGSTGVAARVGG